MKTPETQPSPSIEQLSDQAVLREEKALLLARRSITDGAAYSEDLDGNRTYYFSAPVPE